MKKMIRAYPKKMSTSCSHEGLSYDTDFYAWTRKQSNYLKKREYSKLDLKNLIEEIDSLGRSEKRTLQSHLEILLMHLLKAAYQPKKHSKSWELSIQNSRIKANQVLDDNPSLKPKLKDIISKAYQLARLDAAQETGLDEKIFPLQCPWTKNEILGSQNLC